MAGCNVRRENDPECGKPGRRVHVGCIHEHMAEGTICDEHAAINLNWLCNPCKDADGHECPLVITEMEEADSADVG